MNHWWSNEDNRQSRLLARALPCSFSVGQSVLLRSPRMNFGVIVEFRGAEDDVAIIRKDGYSQTVPMEWLRAK